MTDVENSFRQRQALRPVYSDTPAQNKRHLEADCYNCWVRQAPRLRRHHGTGHLNPIRTGVVPSVHAAAVTRLRRAGRVVFEVQYWCAVVQVGRNAANAAVKQPELKELIARQHNTCADAVHHQPGRNTIQQRRGTGMLRSRPQVNRRNVLVTVLVLLDALLGKGSEGAGVTAKRLQILPIVQLHVLMTRQQVQNAALESPVLLVRHCALIHQGHDGRGAMAVARIMDGLDKGWVALAVHPRQLQHRAAIQVFSYLRCKSQLPPERPQLEGVSKAVNDASTTTTARLPQQLPHHAEDIPCHHGYLIKEKHAHSRQASRNKPKAILSEEACGLGRRVSDLRSVLSRKDKEGVVRLTVRGLGGASRWDHNDHLAMSWPTLFQNAMKAFQEGGFAHSRPAGDECALVPLGKISKEHLPVAKGGHSPKFPNSFTLIGCLYLGSLYDLQSASVEFDSHLESALVGQLLVACSNMDDRIVTLI